MVGKLMLWCWFGGCVVDAMACVKTKQREVDGKH
jgi:hypothetical protein